MGEVELSKRSLLYIPSTDLKRVDIVYFIFCFYLTSWLPCGTDHNDWAVVTNLRGGNGRLLELILF